MDRATQVTLNGAEQRGLRPSSDQIDLIGSNMKIKTKITMLLL